MTPSNSYQIEFVQALPTDAADLTRIAHAAKAHWGYPEEWLAMWEPELTISPDQLRQNYFVKAMSAEHIAGFAGLQPIAGESQSVELLHCWVLAEFMSQGIGRGLFEQLLGHVRKQGTFERMRIYSDPHALEFYKAMKCIEIGQEPTKIKGRTLPIMEYSFSTL